MLQNTELDEQVTRADEMMGDTGPSRPQIPHGVTYARKATCITPHLFYTHSRTLDPADERPHSI
jgi:hypothetical protein